MKIPLLLALILASFAAQAELLIAEKGGALSVILVDPGATAPELNAAHELAATLGQITGASFEMVTNTTAPKNAILVGPGEASKREFPEVPFAELGDEELVIKTKGNRLLLAGGRPRGTLYAVSRFLEQQCNVRWWTPWASRVPKQTTLRVGDLNQREQPAFEMREPFWYPAFDPAWAWHNRANGQSARIPAELGNCIRYQGFVHTFYPFIPPAEHFASHPEWFSLVKGKRSTDRAQLCLTNPQLRDFMVERVKQQLRDAPDARIISVSQNDWYGACECPDCKALDEAEGSHAGTMLAFVNYVAEKIEPEFPQVAVDTLAYQYTRKPPRTIRPRPNVIVRLCSIECNFREPLAHPSNASFADDIRGWSKICNRLYIWDYTTDFAHYVQPHPNWYVLDENLRFFRDHNVRGVFEQGAYQSHGSEFAELRGWVLAQLLWDPSRDVRALIGEFLEGYYGPDVAPILQRYLDLMHTASEGFNLTCFARTEAPHLLFESLAKAEALFKEAEAAAESNPEFLERVRIAHLPVRYAWLARWDALRQEGSDAGAGWPLPDDRKAVADEWLAVAGGVPDKPWTKVSLINEWGQTPQDWVGRILEK